MTMLVCLFVKYFHIKFSVLNKLSSFSEGSESEAQTVSIFSTLISHFSDRSFSPTLHKLHLLCKPDQLHFIQKNIKTLIRNKYSTIKKMEMLVQ